LLLGPPAAGDKVVLPKTSRTKGELDRMTAAPRIKEQSKNSSASSARSGTLTAAAAEQSRSHKWIQGIGHLKHDFELSRNVIRNFHGQRIRAVLDEIFPRKATAEWLAELSAADILATEVVDYRHVLASVQARANGYLREMEHPVAGRVTVAGSPVSIGGEVSHEARARAAPA